VQYTRDILELRGEYEMKSGMYITYYKAEMTLKGNREWRGGKR
jgi:hypothetical protein